MTQIFTIILLIPQEITASSFCQELLIDIVHLTVAVQDRKYLSQSQQKYFITTNKEINFHIIIKSPPALTAAAVWNFMIKSLPMLYNNYKLINPRGHNKYNMSNYNSFSCSYKTYFSLCVDVKERRTKKIALLLVLWAQRWEWYILSLANVLESYNSLFHSGWNHI